MTATCVRSAWECLYALQVGKNETRVSPVLIQAVDKFTAGLWEGISSLSTETHSNHIGSNCTFGPNFHPSTTQFQ